jgi:hypothetical protein
MLEQLEVAFRLSQAKKKDDPYWVKNNAGAVPFFAE